MAFDGYFIAKTIEEIEPQIIGKRVDKILINNHYLSLKLGKIYLCFTLDYIPGLFYISNESIDNTNHEFANLLKKHLLSYRLSRIEQNDKDRIINFTFEGVDLIKGITSKTLVLESFGRSFNLILLEENRIINAYKLVHDLEGKTVLPNINYEVVNSNKRSYNQNDIGSLNVSEIIANFEGISPLLASYLSNQPLDLNNMAINPVKNIDNNQFYWFNLFDSNNIQTYPTISSLLQDLRIAKKLNTKPYEKFITTEISKAKKRVLNLENDLSKHQANFQLKEIADQIYASNLDLSKQSSHFYAYPLNPELTLNENAQKFYLLYKKAKSSFNYIGNEIEKSKEKIDLFSEFLETLTFLEEEDLDDFALMLSNYGFKYKTQRKSKPNQITIASIKYLDAEIFIGKNSNQNKHLLSKIAKNDDLWLHVKSGTGAHVIVKGKVTPKVIEKAAQYAAFYSNYKHSSSIPVDYTLVRYVTKIRKSETFKATYTNYKTIYISSVNQEILANH